MGPDGRVQVTCVCLFLVVEIQILAYMHVYKHMFASHANSIWLGLN